MTLVGSEVLGRPAQKTPSSTHPLFTYLSYPFIWPDHLHPRPCPGHPSQGCVLLQVSFLLPPNAPVPLCPCRHTQALSPAGSRLGQQEAITEAGVEGYIGVGHREWCSKNREEPVQGSAG